MYCNAIAAGGVKEWDFAWKMYKNATIASEADKLMSALSCTRQPWLLNRSVIKIWETLLTVFLVLRVVIFLLCCMSVLANVAKVCPHPECVSGICSIAWTQRRYVSRMPPPPFLSLLIIPSANLWRGILSEPTGTIYSISKFSLMHGCLCQKNMLL